MRGFWVPPLNRKHKEPIVDSHLNHQADPDRLMEIMSPGKGAHSQVVLLQVTLAVPHTGFELAPPSLEASR